MKNLSYFVFLFFFTGCSSSGSNSSVPAETRVAAADTVEKTTEISQPEETPAKIASTERNVAPPQKSYPKEFSAGKINFKIESPETERSATVVKVEGEAPSKFSREFAVEGSVQDAFLLDLDKDGFSELYLVVASEGQLELKGYASYRDRSAGEIYVKDTDAKRQAESDRIFVENGLLFRTFKTRENAVSKFKYELKKGETSFVLSPKASE